ncbi:hypothetical protein RchiOBHm_Chr2g0133851 [Rosa chinensis]|uniref:Uncharacterized protein n=1 Tax=Rosa chinensis TaxID=74649 RepID=A0A2P6RVQ3_ROSCH|nr:hypothetical protein RchiOBHm_Chr2g0133851 [Rosa chinensis]
MARWGRANTRGKIHFGMSYSHIVVYAHLQALLDSKTRHERCPLPRHHST